jgi:hypothetical protein
VPGTAEFYEVSNAITITITTDTTTTTTTIMLSLFTSFAAMKTQTISM